MLWTCRRLAAIGDRSALAGPARLELEGVGHRQRPFRQLDVGAERSQISDDVYGDKTLASYLTKPMHTSTSYVERQNLTMRMHLRRFTRLTNAFSKKAENQAHAVAIHFIWYNFAKIHQTLRITPAMAAGATDRVWDAEDIVGLLEK